MPQSDPGGNMQGGYGGNFGGFGGSSMASQPGGPAPGSLGFGGMSPGGYDSDTYAANAAGINAGQPGFGARVAAARAARQAALRASRTGRRRGGVGVTAPGVAAPGVVAPTPAPIDPVTGVPIPQPKPATWAQAYQEYTPEFLDPRNMMNTGTWNVNLPQQGYDPLSSMGTVTNPGPYLGTDNGPGTLDPYHGAWGNLGNAVSGFGNLVTGGNRRQFGGPVAPGGQYTVGENGPETLQMGAQGGQVIPNNPADKLGGINPQMIQSLVQLMQQRKQGQPGGNGMGMPPPRPFKVGGDLRLRNYMDMAKRGVG